MNEQETRDAYQAEVEQSEAARQALQNPAIMAYFREVETKAVDALLSVDLSGDPTTWLRLTTVAQTVRRMSQFLQDARDSGAYAADALKRMKDQKAT